MNIMIIIGAIAGLVAGGYFLLQYYKKKNISKLFNEVYEFTKQVPPKKKHSFLLLMFKESVSRPIKKSKSDDMMKKLNNPKYLEVQMLNMTKILKNRENVKDVKMKESLKLLTQYLEWEKEKNNL